MIPTRETAKEPVMEGKSLRVIVIFGVMASLALAVMMAFSLNQMPDAQLPQVASGIAGEFTRALEPGHGNVRITMLRDGKGSNAARTYVLTLRPGKAIAADERALARLMFRASERCAVEIGQPPCDVTIRCVAELAEGRTKEASFAKERGNDRQSLALIRPIAAAPAGAQR
jgi:hypothetical protein